MEFDYSDSVGEEKSQRDIEREIENTKSDYIWLMPFCYWRVIKLDLGGRLAERSKAVASGAILFR